jgi:hypothetical protein
VWYASVERSTGFGPPRTPATREQLPPHLQQIADAARPHYERLLKFKLTPVQSAT